MRLTRVKKLVLGKILKNKKLNHPYLYPQSIQKVKGYLGKKCFLSFLPFAWKLSLLRDGKCLFLQRISPFFS